jgi:4-nitrophenyl phosphatase
LDFPVFGHTLRLVKINFDQFKAILLDLDGTIYHEECVLPGAVELVDQLQKQRRGYAFLTNSTSSPQRIANRLDKMGIHTNPELIHTAAQATADYLIERYGPRPRVFNLATEGLEDMLSGKVDWVQSAADPCDAVVAGAMTNLYATEDRQRTALALLRRGTALVGICADRVYPSPRGIEFGSGAFCSILSYAANVTPVFCGKPEERFFKSLCTKLDLDPAECLLIGDNLESDIFGGNRSGMQTMLVLTGVAISDDLARIEPTYQPGFVIQSLKELHI